MLASKLRFYSRLQLAAASLKKAADAALLGAAGLTTAQAALMTVIAGEAGATQKYVARALGLNESAVTAMVTRLMRSGFVARTRSPDDARAWCLTLTEAGRAALDRAAGPFQTINAGIEESLADHDLKTVTEALDRLTARFGKD